MRESATPPELKRTLKSLIPGSGVEIAWNGKPLLNFASNDYLGLKNHPLLKSRACRYIELYGVGAGSSRLVSGTHIYHDQLETRLAETFGFESALIMNTGYQANVSLLSVLADRDTLILLDRHSHHSLVQGARLSRAKIHRFADFDHLEKLLKLPGKKIVVTESLFSMEGDITDLPRLIRLKNEYGAFLYVDDAHAVGVLGENGAGLTHGLDIDLVLGTFSKAFGSFGAYVLCSNRLKEQFVQACGGLIYTTALPPPVIGAIEAALDLIPTMESERSHLQNISRYLRLKLLEKGYRTGRSASHIIPIIVGSEESAVNLERRLLELGCYCPAIRPPTVENGESRVRISLTSGHTIEHIEQLLL